MNKPNVPGQIQPGPEYSFKVDWRVNSWMFTALAISVATDLFYRREVHEWPEYVRVIAAVTPLLAILLWVRRLARWIRGMDEMYRAVTTAACLFATFTTFFVIAAWRHLSRMGVLHLVFPGRMKAYADVDFCVPWLILWLMMVFYLIGQTIFARRYR
jgi:hypothetical protein